MLQNMNVYQKQDSCTWGLYLFQSGDHRCKPSHNFGPAIRNHYLIHIVRSGCGIFQSNNKSYKVDTGEGFLIEPNQVTYYEADASTPWHYYWIGFDGHEVKNILQLVGISQKNPIFSLSDLTTACEILDGIQKTSYQESNYLSIQGALYNFFSYIQGKELSVSTDTLAQQAADYIHKNFSYPIQITEIAYKLSIDRTQLFRLFKESYCMSPQAYLIEYRLKQAAYLLEQPNITITEAMYSSGFTNPSYFSRQFHSKYGCSPSMYRTEIQNSETKIYVPFK